MARSASGAPEGPASAGHKLGQMVGDWYEEHFVLPLLRQVADRLELYLDHRFRARPARGEKITWADADGNAVNYDFVMELDGTDTALGIPVAFFERFWRRGARHSKDKARDDSGKLLPMRGAHPTARFLGVVAAGDFTAPARQLVQSRMIDLFYVPKAKIVDAFAASGAQIDYADRASEAAKAALAAAFQTAVSDPVKAEVATRLRQLVGAASINTYVDRVRAALGALPQEMRFVARKESKAAVFETIAEATAFLDNPTFDFAQPAETFNYEITYTDGTEFERPACSIEELKQLHRQIERLANHLTSLTAE
jgi:hypothetical protein